MKKSIISMAMLVSLTARAQLLFTTSKANPSCNAVCNGMASVAVSGGTTPYSYQWSTGAVTSNVIHLCAGTYTVTVTDANAVTKSVGVSLIAPAPLAYQVSVTGNDASVINLTGGAAPYTYLWSTGATTPGVTGLPSGIYWVNVYDKKNCLLRQGFIIQ